MIAAAVPNADFVRLPWSHGPGRLGVAERNPVKKSSSSDFERPEHAPRSPAEAQTCTAVYAQPSCVPRVESARNDPWPGEKSFTWKTKAQYVPQNTTGILLLRTIDYTRFPSAE